MRCDLVIKVEFRLPPFGWILRETQIETRHTDVGVFRRIGKCIEIPAQATVACQLCALCAESGHTCKEAWNLGQWRRRQRGINCRSRQSAVRRCGWHGYHGLRIVTPVY